jgi:hypothetical protein
VRIWAVIFMAIALAGVLASCGSGGGDSGSSQALTKKAFVKQANSICTRGIKEKDQILDSGFKKLAQKGTEPPKKDVEAIVLKIIPPLEATTEKLGELQPPSQDEETVSALMQEWEDEIDKAAEDPGTAINATFMETPNLKAREYGLSSCNL